MTRSRASSTTVAVAVRGFSFRMAISPRNSPRPNVASVRSAPWSCFEIRTRPVWITNITSPFSPSAKKHLARAELAPEAREEGIGHGGLPKSTFAICTKSKKGGAA